MTVHRWDPIRIQLQLPLEGLDAQIERAFDSLLTTPWQPGPEQWMPQIDVYETPDEFLIEADVPGLDQNELRIEVDEDAVTICGTRSSRRTETTPRGAIRVERRLGTFCRRIPLGHSVDGQRVLVEQDQGVCRIRIPKSQDEDQDQS